MSGSVSGSSPSRKVTPVVYLSFHLPLEVAAERALLVTKQRFDYYIPEEAWRAITTEQRLHILKIVLDQHDGNIPPPMVLKPEHVLPPNPESGTSVDLDWPKVLADYAPGPAEESESKGRTMWPAALLLLALVFAFAMWATRG